jgi:hypothetical protein
MIIESANGTKFWMYPVTWGLVLALLCGGPARADEIADIYQRLQNSPQSVPLNLQYAQAAEKAGKLKWALPAYERALSADPRNREARTGIDRITSKLRAEAAPS